MRYSGYGPLHDDKKVDVEVTGGPKETVVPRGSFLCLICSLLLVALSLTGVFGRLSMLVVLVGVIVFGVAAAIMSMVSRRLPRRAQVSWAAACVGSIPLLLGFWWVFVIGFLPAIIGP